MCENCVHQCTLIVAPFTKANGLMVFAMAKESKSGSMAVDMRVSGVTEKLTVVVNCIMPTEISTRVIGSMTKQMVTEPTRTLTGPSMWAHGATINSTDLAWRHGLMALYMKENITRARKMGAASSLSPMDLCTKVSSK